MVFGYYTARGGLIISDVYSSAQFSFFCKQECQTIGIQCEQQSLALVKVKSKCFEMFSKFENLLTLQSEDIPIAAHVILNSINYIPVVPYQEEYLPTNINLEINFFPPPSKNCSVLKVSSYEAWGRNDST